MFFIEKVSQTHVFFCTFSLFFFKGSLCQNQVFLLFLTLGGEVLEPNLPHFGVSFKGPPKVGSKTSPQARPGDHLGSMFDYFCIVFQAFGGAYFHSCLYDFYIPFKKYPSFKTFPSELSAEHLVPMQVPRPLPQGSSRAQFGSLC